VNVKKTRAGDVLKRDKEREREREREREIYILMIPSGTDATAKRKITARSSRFFPTLSVLHKANTYL
jgi:hypothetical protein